MGKMIFFGTRGKTIAGQDINGIVCPHCGQSQHASFGILRHFHLYWIPFFLTAKQVGIECQHCKMTRVGKEIPAEIHQQLQGKVFTKWQIGSRFTGLIILSSIVLMLLLITSSRMN